MKSENILKKERKELQSKVTRIEEELQKKTSEIKDKNKQLKIQSEIIEKLFANTHFLIAVLDTDFNFIRVNKAYALAGGMSENEFSGKNHFDLYPNEENIKIFRKVLETKKPFIALAKPFLYKNDPDKGTTYWNWSLNPITDESGRVQGLILILLDVTVRIESEKKLNETQRLSDIGALATTVAHELRSPLGVIQAAVYNIRKKNKNESIVRNIERIERKIDESEKIINNLLNYSRIKQPALKKIHFYNFLNECVNDIKRHFNKSDIRLIRKFDDFKDIILKIDPFQIREVFINLLTNAFQSFPEETDKANIVEISGTLEKSDVKIIITDNGQGIRNEDLKMVFDPFFTRKSRGTGLGLTICRELINLHKGKINLKSEEGEGTELAVLIPRNLYYDK